MCHLHAPEVYGIDAPGDNHMQSHLDNIWSPYFDIMKFDVSSFDWTNTDAGFTEANMYFYLKGGLSEINRFPPSTGLTFNTFPLATYSQLLIDISTFISLQSQGMCAIDTDSNYSMQGNNFVVDHWSKISSFMSFLHARINEQLKQFKLMYLPGMSVGIERGPGFRSTQLWNASPPGTNFGNVLGTR